MSDENFISEVTEELKYEQAHALWGKYGLYVIFFAVALVVFTGFYQIYYYFSEQKTAKIGDKFFEALLLAHDNKYDQALKQLNEVELQKSGYYPLLVQFRKASLLNQQGKVQEAEDSLAKLIANKGNPNLFDQIARLKLSYLLLDDKLEKLPEIDKLLAPCLIEDSSFKFLAWEVLGFKALRLHDFSLAKKYFKQISDKAEPGSDVMRRSIVLLSSLAAK